jgi:ketosteroid isomerase-like protein
MPAAGDWSDRPSPRGSYGRRVSDSDDVLAAANDRAQALVDSDADRLAELMHPQLRWTTHQGDVFDRERYIAGNTDGSLHWIRQSLDDPNVIVVGDAAVLTATVEDCVERQCERQNYRLRLTLTWVRTPIGWQCLAGHAGPGVVD